MSETLPKWSVRLDASRPANNPGFTDLVPIIAQHFKAHVQAEQYLGPYNARQRGSQFPYRAPDRESLRQMIKQGGMNEFSYHAFLGGLIRFCEQHKGMRALPTPHPSTIHSIQLPLPAFVLKPGKEGETEVHIVGVEVPVIVKGLRNLDEVKFIIVRPKLSQLGTASANNWEVLFFRTPLGYVPDWADSHQNPRYSGIF